MAGPEALQHNGRSEAAPSFATALRFWLKLGFISFGGPAGQIAIMHEELVVRRRWISEARFLHALNFCMLLPGPEAQQLAIYAGWLLHGTAGGLVAGTLFVLPSALLLWAFSWAYVSFGTMPWMAAVLYGLKPAVLAIVGMAMLRIGGKVLKNPAMWALAIGAFVGLAFLRLPFPSIVLGAGVIGFFAGRLWPNHFVLLHHGSAEVVDKPAKISPLRSLRVLAIGLACWWLPLLAIGGWQGWKETLFREGLFFSKAALVTFGGAYAVLPYVAQQAVEQHGWLTAPQMADGLALAETTPGPLIMVLQFVGFLGAWYHPGALSPLASATLGAAVTAWATFAPCFLWIFLGAPYLERLRDRPQLTAALSAITAAVVGVIANLALWFGWHFFRRGEAGFDWLGAGFTAVIFLGMWRWKWGVVPVVLGSIVAGVIFHLVKSGLG